MKRSSYLARVLAQGIIMSLYTIAIAGCGYQPQTGICTGPAADFLLPARPTVDTGIAYIGGEYGSAYAIRLADHQMLWRYDTAKSYVSPPVVSQNAVYVSALDTTYALNAEPGTLIWKISIVNTIISVAPAVTEGIVFVQSGQSIVALQADNGVTLWSNRFKQLIDSPLAA